MRTGGKTDTFYTVLQFMMDVVMVGLFGRCKTLLYFTHFIWSGTTCSAANAGFLSCQEEVQDFSDYKVDSHVNPGGHKSQGTPWSFVSVVNNWVLIKSFSERAKQSTVYRSCSELEHPVINKESHTWYHVKDRKVMVYSAFYERRKQAYGPSVRILGAGYQAAYNQIGSLYCQIWFSDRVHPISVSAVYQVIYPSTMHPDMWVSHFIMCKIPELHLQAAVPYAIAVTGEQCEPSEHHLFVVNRDVPNIGDTFGVCLPPIYGKYRNWNTIIEMFEMYKLLGASEIITYNVSIHHSTDAVLHSYMTDAHEKVHVYDWKIPGGHTTKVSYYIQRGSLNDCLYRMAHRHRFVAIQDLDEVFVPRNGHTWPELFFEYKLYKPQYGVYMFQHYYFRRNDTHQDPPYLVTQNSFWRTDVVYPPGKIRCKSMYNGELAVKIDVHYHYELIKGAEEHLVEPSEGVLHHYRNEPMETFRKNPDKFTFLEDDYMTYYKDRLLENYRSRNSKVLWFRV